MALVPPNTADGEREAIADDTEPFTTSAPFSARCFSSLAPWRLQKENFPPELNPQGHNGRTAATR
jgi:hypothetical protein